MRTFSIASISMGLFLTFALPSADAGRWRGKRNAARAGKRNMAKGRKHALQMRRRGQGRKKGHVKPRAIPRGQFVQPGGQFRSIPALGNTVRSGKTRTRFQPRPKHRFATRNPGIGVVSARGSRKGLTKFRTGTILKPGQRGVIHAIGARTSRLPPPKHRFSRFKNLGSGGVIHSIGVRKSNLPPPKHRHGSFTIPKRPTTGVFKPIKPLTLIKPAAPGLIQKGVIGVIKPVGGN